MGAGRSRSNNSTVSAGHQVVTDDGASAMCCEVDDDFAATEPITATVDGVGVLVDDGSGVVRLLVAGQFVASLDPGEPVDRLRSCLGRGYRFVGVVTGPGVVRVSNA